jgi:hypothetical protein
MQRKINLYYEIRTMAVFGPAMPVASDIARHLQSRQYLGTTIVVCQSPLSMLSATRKQWLRLARNLQKQRASTLNAEEILRFTHTIMHMQHLQFVAQIPTEKAEAHIFFVTPEELVALPPGCLSLYIATPPRASQLHAWIGSLAADALVIDYEGTLGLDTLGLEPKKEIEKRMLHDWQDLQDFMAHHGVRVQELLNGHAMSSPAMDDALDSLLSTGNEFLRRAAEFQHMLSLSQPVKTVLSVQFKQFEIVMRLAHRVQSLTPGVFGRYLVANFGDRHAESFFLRDAAPDDDELIEQPEGPKEEVTFDSMEGVELVIEYV